MYWNQLDMRLGALQQHYLRGDFTPRQLMEHLCQKRDADTHNPVWIYPLTLAELEPYLARLEQSDPATLPLYGVPFAIKDNLDLAHVPSSAACPQFAYIPEHSATVVARLIEAGAIPFGKTNMDQFATGLVGVRSPHGACQNPFDPAYISGGSSSGSAVAVSTGLVSFSLGTDTAGSGRIPAAFNNLVGCKPTRGRISNTGMIRACRSLDCVSIFALAADDAKCVLDLASTYDSSDEYSRVTQVAEKVTRDQPVLAVPPLEQLEFFGNEAYQACYLAFLESAQTWGWSLETRDFSALFDAAKLLYYGPWVAERRAAFGQFAAQNPDSVEAVMHDVLRGPGEFTATQVFEFQYQMQEYKACAQQLLADVDFALLPTAPTHYQIADVQADPVTLNSNLGTYTNFMNLLDLSAVAIPAGFCDSGLPFGVTLFAPAFYDDNLLHYASVAERQQALPVGCHLPSDPLPQVTTPQTGISLIACGAHMSGLALNHQLLALGAVLIQATHTSENYRLYALAGGPPARPGLVRDSQHGVTIAVEEWRIPPAQLGTFLQGIPHPLGLGKVELADGRFEVGFICEPEGVQGAQDISQFGGWRGYLASQS